MAGLAGWDADNPFCFFTFLILAITVRHLFERWRQSRSLPMKVPGK